MIPRRVFALCAAIGLVSASLTLLAQDDMYGRVSFTNESGQPVKIKVWNTRGENGAFEAAVEIGKSVIFTNKDGQPLHVGLGSSWIQVNGAKPTSVRTVASRKDDAYVIVWTKEGFKPKAKE